MLFCSFALLCCASFPPPSTPPPSPLFLPLLPLLLLLLPVRIEETWRLWCKFMDDYSRFEDWLRTAERTAANPASSEVLYTSAKEELKKFEVR